MTKLTAWQGDVLIAGAGFAGMYMLHKVRSLGLRGIILEAGGGVGGTWYWNRYPGARCDVESVEYSFSFSRELEQEWDWSERYATQGEILRYANHVAERFELRSGIRFDHPIERAEFNPSGSNWQVESSGELYEARFLILATGCLSSPNQPLLPGQDQFNGRILHTGYWPHEEVDFRGKAVVVIGTGSSAIQSVPVIARDAASLCVMQRTANFAVPAHNRPLSSDELDKVKANYPALRADARTRRSYIRYDINPNSALEVSENERQEVYEARWQQGGLGFNGCFADQMLDAAANAHAADFIRGKIKSIVNDPVTAALLAPTSIVGCKRLCVEGGYFEAFNRDNVQLVDLNAAPLDGLSPTCVVAGGEEYPADIVVMATGFDAMTGSILKIDIRSPAGSLADIWADGPVNYLGLAVSGFPNMFTITGPGSPSVLSNMLMSIEQHVEWVSDCLAAMTANRQTLIEASADAQSKWVNHVRELAGTTLYPHCNSWYLGANIPGKKRVFMPYLGCPPYRGICDKVAAGGYEGFELSA